MMKKPIFLCLLASLFLLSACNGTPEKVDRPKAEVEEWWNEPGNLQVRGYKAVFVGSAPFLGNTTAARNTSLRDGQEKVASFLKVEIRSLAEDWDKQTGDLMKKSSISSLVNNESFRQTFIKQCVSGSLALKYKKVGDVQYCMVGLKSTKFLQDFSNNVQERFTTMLLTDALKGQARDRLKEMVAKEEKKLSEAAKLVMNPNKKLEKAK